MQDSEDRPPPNHHHLYLNREGRWGTTDDFATSFLHFSLFSIALWDLANSRPVHFLMLSSHLFLCPSCFLSPFTVPCKMVLTRPEERETWPYYCSLRLFTMVRRSSCGPSSTTLGTRGLGSRSAWHQYCCCQRSTVYRTRLPHGGWSRLYPLLVWEEQGRCLWCRLHDQNFYNPKITELVSWSFRPPHVPKTPNPGQQVCNEVSNCPQCVGTNSAGSAEVK